MPPKPFPFAGKLYQTAFERNDFTYGVAMFQRGYLDQAAASFKQVIAAKPEDPEAFYNLGTLELRRNNFADAGQHLGQAVKLRPNYPKPGTILGCWMFSRVETRKQSATSSSRSHYVQTMRLPCSTWETCSGDLAPWTKQKNY